MHAFEGELLIGGMALRKLQGKLEQEEQAPDSHDWLLTGQVCISPEQAAQLALERRYLLKLDDGREGLVELTRFSPIDGNLLAGFRPRKAR